MLLAYVDESYTDKWFVLGALIVETGQQAADIEAGLNRMVSQFRGTPGITLPANAELHGHDMFHGKGDWEGAPIRARIAMYRQAMQVVKESGAKLAFRGMDCERQRGRYYYPDPPHEVVLNHLLESIDSRAKSVQDYALVVADEIHTHERHRDNFRQAKRWGTPGYRSSTLDCVIDTLHFAPSHHSRLLQAADLATFMRRRRKSHPETDPRAQRASDSIWAEIAAATVVDHIWLP